MYNCFHVLKFQFEKKNSVRHNLEVSVYDTSFSYANFQNHAKCVGQTFLQSIRLYSLYQTITLLTQSPRESTIQLTEQTMSLSQKLLLVSKSPGADMPFNQQIFQNIPFDDDLAHVTLFVIVIEDVTTYYDSKNCQKTNKK